MPPAIRTALIPAIALLAWAGISWLNNDSRQINRELDELRSLVSKQSTESQLEALSKATAIGSMFAPNFEIRAEQLQIATRDIRRIIGSVMQYRSRSDSISMGIHDHNLFVHPKLGRATSDLTVDFNKRFGALDQRESYRLDINWIDTPDGWKVDYLNLVEIQRP